MVFRCWGFRMFSKMCVILLEFSLTNIGVLSEKVCFYCFTRFSYSVSSTWECFYAADGRGHIYFSFDHCAHHMMTLNISVSLLQKTEALSWQIQPCGWCHYLLLNMQRGSPLSLIYCVDLSLSLTHTRGHAYIQPQRLKKKTTVNS